MTTTVGELREILSDFHPDTEVILSKDEEGNDFKPLLFVNDELVSKSDPLFPIHPDDLHLYDDSDLTTAVVLSP